MKKIYFILIFLAFTYLLNAQWEQMSNGIGSTQQINSLAVSGNNIFAGTNAGIYLSTNNGTSWTLSALNNLNITSISIGINNIFAGTYDGHVYRSTNNGTSWIQTSLNINFVLSLIASGNNIFAGSNFGLYLSTNNGMNWVLSQSNLYVTSFTNSGNNLFAGSGDIFLTTNNGNSWTQITFTNQGFYSLVSNGNSIYAGTASNGVLLSTNYGMNWTQSALNNKGVYSLALNSNNIFAGTSQNGVYLSTNNGFSWLIKNQGFSVLPTVKALLIENSYIFAGTENASVWRRSYSEILGIKQISEIIPQNNLLNQNFPNPFNPLTNISFKVASYKYIKLQVFDILGKEIAILVNEKLQPGTYVTSWDASQFSSGIYLYKLTAGDYSVTKKMTLIK